MVHKKNCVWRSHNTTLKIIFVTVNMFFSTLTTNGLSAKTNIIREAVWRNTAKQHAERVHKLIAPGFVNENRNTRQNKQQHTTSDSMKNDDSNLEWTRLDKHHPLFNFLLEYYGIVGRKGTRRLGRWCPPLASNGGPTHLQGATADDLESTLHLRGATFAEDGSGITYDARSYYQNSESNAATAFLWYQSILSSTQSAKPVTHCHGLHEWAMVYAPPGTEKPPSTKYQSHLPFRVDQDTINQAVERRGVHCTHVDALRFFSPAAAPLNHHGSELQREDQLILEQPGCVHAHMDLLKIALRLTPWVDAELVGDALMVAIHARELDVGASPYDVSKYGIEPVCIETSSGRKLYRERQEALMHEAQPVRQKLLEAYTDFLGCAFEPELVEEARGFPSKDRFAVAMPGGQPWRRSLIDSTKGTRSANTSNLINSSK